MSAQVTKVVMSYGVQALDRYAGANENFVLVVLCPHATFSPIAPTRRSRASVTAQ